MTRVDPASLGARLGARQREPSESLARLEAAARSALGNFALPARSAVAIFGSIAEGFGNPASDIDVLVVVPDAAGCSGLRQMVAFEQQRVELCVRGGAELGELAFRVVESARAELPISSADLDFFHRTAYALPLFGHEAFEQLRGAFDRDLLARARHRQELRSAHAAWRRASALSALARPLEVVGLGKQALRHAATAWACARGETYVSRKFLFRQLERAGLPAELRARLEAQLGAPSTADAGAWMGELAGWFGELELPPLPAAAPAVVRLAGGVRTLLLGKHWAVSLDGAGSAVLRDDPAAGAALGATLEAGRAELPLASAAAARAWGVLHRVGLAELELGPDGERWREPVSLEPRAGLGEVKICSTGLAASEAVAITRLELRALVQAGVELVTHAFAVENADEDAAGALLVGDWATLAAALWAKAYRSATVALCHEGVVPAPAEPALAAALAERPRLAPLAAALDRLGALAVRDAAGAARYHAGVGEVLAAVPAGAARHFRGCHDSAIGWLKLLSHCLRPWALAARQLGVAVPPEIEEMFAVALEERLVTDEAAERLVGWRRELGFERVLEQMLGRAASDPETGSGEKQ